VKINVQAKKRVIVLDTSAFIMGYNPMSINEKQYTAPLVLEELSPKSSTRLRLNLAMETGKIKLQAPKPGFIRKIRNLSGEVGDLRHLSDADVQILALSLELSESGFNALVVSDDYAVQNVADQLGFEYRSLATFGIRYRFKWVLYCPACKRKYPQEYENKRCEVCGTLLKMKVLKVTPARRGRKIPNS